MDIANHELRAFYDHASRLEPTSEQIASVLQAVRPRPARQRLSPLARRTLVVAVALTGLMASAVAYPGIRDAIDAFFNGGAVPGAPAEYGSLPGWLTGSGPVPGPHAFRGSQRLLAQQDGQKMYAFRDPSGRACVVFATDSDTCSDSAAWHRLFDGHAVVKLASGVGPTQDGKVAVFGLARNSITTVELRDGTSTVTSAPVTNNGWVIVAPQGTHQSLVGLSASGATVETLDAGNWTWTFCRRESGCR